MLHLVHETRPRFRNKQPTSWYCFHLILPRTLHFSRRYKQEIKTTEHVYKKRVKGGRERTVRSLKLQWYVFVLLKVLKGIAENKKRSVLNIWLTNKKSRPPPSREEMSRWSALSAGCHAAPSSRLEAVNHKTNLTGLYRDGQKADQHHALSYPSNPLD